VQEKRIEGAERERTSGQHPPSCTKRGGRAQRERERGKERQREREVEVERERKRERERERERKLNARACRVRTSIRRYSSRLGV
jgi:hypothetical protein